MIHRGAASGLRAFGLVISCLLSNHELDSEAAACVAFTNDEQL